MPVKKNAIYDLSQALLAVQGYDFPVKLNEGWGNPHLLSSYFYHYAHLHAARAAAELGDDAAKEVLAAIRAALLGHVEIDDTWVDWEQMGKTYGTASALLALRIAR